jgi:adenylyltransferase/sulfurtransferase
MNTVFARYDRQLILPGFGSEAQAKLQSAHVLVVGAGGLGCPVLQYLTAAGVGKITLSDGDVVSVSNLHRQVLYAEKDVGRSKAEVAGERLNALNAEVQFAVFPEHWTVRHCLDHMENIDLVIDCSDNFPTRYLLDDACRLFSIPLVFGAVSRYEGQLAVFAPGTAHYRDVFPHPPVAGEIQNCGEVGVVGMLPGMIGSMQAMEALKWLTGIGKPLVNKLLTYNALDQQVYTLELTSGATAGPQTIEQFENWIYEEACTTLALEVEELMDGWTVVDVRGKEEQPRLRSAHRSIPLPELPGFLEDLKGDRIIFVCQSGRRSKLAVELLKSHDPAAQVCSLKGGIQQHQKMQQYE